MRFLAQSAWRATKDFFHYQGVSQAAGLAFFALLSFIPLIFLVLSLAGLIWGDQEAVRGFIDEQLQQTVPWLQDTIERRIRDFLDIAANLSWLSVGFILWTSGVFFAALQTDLHLPWRREHDFSKQAWRILLPWVIGPVLAFLLTGAMLMTHVAGYVFGLLPPELAPLDFSPAFWSWAALAVVLFLLYKIMLPLFCPTFLVFIISFFVSGASQLLTMVFVRLLSQVPNYSIVYGSLAGIVLFLLWLNYNMGLILWGAHFVRVWANAERGQGPELFDDAEKTAD